MKNGEQLTPRLKNQTSAGITDSNSGVEDEHQLPRRDLFLLPVLSLLTICLIFFVMKFLSNHFYSSYGDLQQKCFSYGDKVHGVHGIPNSVCTDKLAEGEVEEYRFNSCGHRAGMECGTKPADSYRVVMLGSSVAFGLNVSREDSFAALLPEELSQHTGRKVELYNEGAIYHYVHNIDTNFTEILAAKPDMILWIITPYDVKAASNILPPKILQNSVTGVEHLDTTAGTFARLKYNLKNSFAGKTIPDGAKTFWDNEVAYFAGGQTGIMLQHYLFMSQSQYMKVYLSGGVEDRETIYLRTHPTDEWQNELRQFDGYAASIAGKSKAAGVPLVAVFMPQRGQTSMISMGTWPSGFDPYQFNNELHTMITSHGGIYIDILPEFREITNPEQYYLPFDGHLTAEGHAAISKLLAKALTNGAVPALKTTDQQQATQKSER